MSPEGGTPPEDAFAALGNELRVTILHVLADAAEAGEAPLSFTAVYRRLDIDSTSRLSYHLDHLEGVFVRRSEDGYALTQAGDRVVRALRSGTYTETPSFPVTELAGRCHACGTERLRAAYCDPFLTVTCTGCEAEVVRYDLPPAESRDRSPMEILRSCDRRARHEYELALGGTCSVCGGLTSVETRRRDETDTDAEEYYCVATCEPCGHRVFAPLGVHLLSHPAVVSFYWERGIDTSAIRFWELYAYLEDWATTAVGPDPCQFDVTVRHDGDELRLRLDEQLGVTVPGRPPLALD